MNLFVLCRYLRYRTRGRLPSEVMLDISGVCNARCGYCPSQDMPSSRKGFMSLETFHETLREMKHHGIKQVRLYSTGEPLLHPDFDYIIRRLVAEHFHVVVSTNGLLLDEHMDVLGLVDMVQLSVSGWDEKSYAMMHPPLQFQTIRKNVERFHGFLMKRKMQLSDAGVYRSNRNPTVCINLLVTQKTPVEWFRHVWGMYVDNIRVNHLVGTTVYRDGVFVTEQPMGGLCFPSVMRQGGGCSYPFDTLVVSFDGKIGLCCADYHHCLPLGYITDGLRQVFNSMYLCGVRQGFLHGVPKVCRGCSRFLQVKQ